MSVASCVRAIAGDAESEVTYGKDKPGMAGDRARVADYGRATTLKSRFPLPRAGRCRWPCGGPDSAAPSTPRICRRATMPAPSSTLWSRPCVAGIGFRAMDGMGETLAQMLDDSFDRELNPLTHAQSTETRRWNMRSPCRRAKADGCCPPRSAAAMVDVRRETQFQARQRATISTPWRVPLTASTLRALPVTLIADLDMGDELGSDSSKFR